MKDGLVKVAAASIEITVADVKSNTSKIFEKIDLADNAGVNLIVLPELCVTGYTCGDLFFSNKLIAQSHSALCEIRDFTSGKYPVVVVGVPLSYNNKLYNCAAVLYNGKIIGIVPKSNLQNCGEFYEKRTFNCGSELDKTTDIIIGGDSVKFGSMIFRNSNCTDFTFGVEICDDLWSADTPATKLCHDGALIIANLSASSETAGKADFRRAVVCSASASLFCGYIYATADYSESTQDAVFSRHNIICDDGIIINENLPFADKEMIIGEIDVGALNYKRRKNTSFTPGNDKNTANIYFNQPIRETQITKHISPTPFIPQKNLNEYCEEVLKIQSFGLRKRMQHTCANKAVIGISGGLDSTLALLVCVRTMKLLGRKPSDILAVTMPCFGTTSRTKSNAVKLCELLGVTIKEINITKSVISHFEDIGQDASNYDVTYENSQARERTQVLMDIANQCGGIVVGTGDLSELALGWATYNGDHMSMYGVNSSVPKTLIKEIVNYEAQLNGGELCKVLLDILDTPVSPELLPATQNDDIAQKTEDLVGPYELHDFFLYHMLRFGETPAKIFRLAKIAFDGAYNDATIIHWLSIFTRRFFSQQFKRSCIPDGPKIGSISLSPRSDWRMPTDASARIWLDEIENLKSLI